MTEDPKARLTPASAVGAVIADRSGLLAQSANVLPPGLKSAMGDVVALSDAERYLFIEHAERAAIFKALTAGKRLDGATLYCTRFPCADCARAIAWSGITRVVFPKGFAGEDRWIDAQRAALRILRAAGLTVRYLPVAESLVSEPPA